jgi:predicted nucleic acid-binding protein
VRLVVADTGPINYLVLIGAVDFLPVLFASVILPSTVQAELADPDAPPLVRSWIANPPVWLEIHETPGLGHGSIEGLDEGEAAAIALASSLGADLLLMGRRGRRGRRGQFWLSLCLHRKAATPSSRLAARAPCFANEVAPLSFCCNTENH